jgi:hypothetical protein
MSVAQKLALYNRHSSSGRRNPVREDVCNVYVGFQGVTFRSLQYGLIPAFGPETTGLNETDYRNYVQFFKSLGFTHIEFAVSWNYEERDYHYPIPGVDCTSDSGLDFLKSRMEYAIDNGMFCLLFLAGDGLSKPKLSDGSYEYNDPVGHTYGQAWLMDNLARIINKLNSITPWTVFCPGYDAVFYGWGDDQPRLVQEFGALFRNLLPSGHLAIEHDVGHIPLGEGDGDYGPNGRMKDFDVIMGEFDQNNLHGNNVWQVLGRTCRPYNRDPQQTDDPDPPMYLADCARGKVPYIIYEFDTFPWVRGLISEDDVRANGRYLKSLAPDNIVCSLL